MINGDESLAIKDLLCPMCLEVHEGMQTKAMAAAEEDEDKPAKDIYQMEREAQEMETRIQETLPPARREACWLFVASVQGLAEVRAQRAVGDWAEQGMLYNILMAEAWKATESYDPTKSNQPSFKRWAGKLWDWTISEFWRVRRLPTESMTGAGGTYFLNNKTTVNAAP